MLLITKGRPEEASTQWAQGGVAVVRDERDPGDSIATHIHDTLVAGAGLSDPAAVELILTEGPAAVQRLIERGALFDAGPDGLLRTREGGHSANRVDPRRRRRHRRRDRAGAAGRPRAAGRAGRAPGAGRGAGRHRPGPRGVGAGAGRRGRADPQRRRGAGHRRRRPPVRGHHQPRGRDRRRLAMALRAGAALADVEFMQFHPTVLWTGPGDLGHRPLVTEAVRGEGAVLIDGAGARIMPGVHPLADLAPRDVVSLAISRRMALAPGGVGDHVFLDATGIAPAVFARRFPTVSAACALAGINPTPDPIPVAPAAHYHCGGVLTDLDGRTTVPGLCSRSARSPAPGCTGPTGWPRTRCWRVW